MKFHPIEEPYMSGAWASKGDRVVEVICTDSCNHTWMVFATIDGRVCKRTEDDPQDYKACMAWARSFLQGKLTPGVWGITRDIRRPVPL